MQNIKFDPSWVDGKMSVSTIVPNSVPEQLKHSHKLYTGLILQPTNIILLPEGEYFLPSSINGQVHTNTAQVYINGILQTNGVNFVEIKHPSNSNVCIGIEIPDELILAGDYIVIEWTVLSGGII